MPLDRTLEIQVNATSNWTANGLGANISYQITGSNPSFPNAITDPQGDIDLSAMPTDPNFTDNIDITFTLNAAMTDQNGNALPARWAVAGEGSGVYDIPEGFCWFCAAPGNTRPMSVAGMNTLRNGDLSVTINDDTPDNDAAQYFFCLGLVALLPETHFITIEPVISGKGGTTHPPTASRMAEQY
jgi:hypothetical protein